MVASTEGDSAPPTPWIEWGTEADPTAGLWDTVVVHSDRWADPPESAHPIAHNGAGTVFFVLGTAGSTSDICNETPPYIFIRCVARPGHDGPHLMCAEEIWMRQRPVVLNQSRGRCLQCHPESVE